jgi:hypothetical protein
MVHVTYRERLKDYSDRLDEEFEKREQLESQIAAARAELAVATDDRADLHAQLAATTRERDDLQLAAIRDESEILALKGEVEYRDTTNADAMRKVKALVRVMEKKLTNRQRTSVGEELAEVRAIIEKEK